MINHVPFLVPNLEEAITKWKAAGAMVEMAESAYARNPLGWAYTPDDLKLLITPDKSLTTPLASPGIQVWVPADSIPELRAWYVKVFAAKAGQKINNGLAINGIPGLRIAATAGRGARGVNAEGRRIDTGRGTGSGIYGPARADESKLADEGTDARPYRL